MIDSRLVKFDAASCGVIETTADMKTVKGHSIPNTPENEKIIKLFSILLKTPKIAIYNTYPTKDKKPSVLMFFKKTIGEQRQAKMVDIEEGDYADKLWNIITGKG